MVEKVKIVDLFAGIGGLRQGVVNSLTKHGLQGEIVFTSEIKKSAIETLLLNYPNDKISGDITKIATTDIPKHDLLLAGFPCQAFSYAGKREGFQDKTRGTLFFDVLRVLKHHKPEVFILENVEGLVTHDRDPENLANKTGRTLNTILDELQKLGYYVSWEVLEATDFYVPQARRRVFITGSLTHHKPLSRAVKRKAEPISSILETAPQSPPDEALDRFNRLLNKKYGEDLGVLEGKIFRDWRGGSRNIHSWDIGLKGETTEQQQQLLETLRVNSTKSKWETKHALKRVGEGFPLTLEQIKTFTALNTKTLKEELSTLTKMGYLKQDSSNTYRISSGKLTFPVSHVLRRDGYSNTIVATDCDRLTVVENKKLRRFTEVELRRLFGFEDTFRFPETLTFKQKCDLFGNSVVVPVAEAVADTIYG